MKPGKTSRPSCWATSRRTGSNAAPCSLSSSRAHVARGLQDLHHVGDDPRGLVRGVAGDEVAQACSNAASSYTGPPARSSSAAIAAVAASSSTARGDACGASISTSCAALPSLEPWYWRSGRGDRQRQQPARARRACSAPAPPRSPARAAPTVSPSSTSDGYARTVWPVPGSATTFGIFPNVQLVWPVRSSFLVAAASARAQRRPGLLAQRGEVLARGDDLALLVLDR